MSQIILASASPRRKELLEQIGIAFEICPAKGEEKITKTNPAEVVEELSKQKAEEVAAMLTIYGEEHQELMTPQDILVIGADTVVAVENQILGKPKDEEDACRMLRLLSGRAHEVYTGVTLFFIDKSGKMGAHVFHETTKVFMKELSEKEIKRYVASGEPMDKAGSYGIQGKCAIYIDKIEGDYNNVVGLPISRIYRELEKLGIDLYAW
ncbi:MAG: Maf family protein [Roseburia sp.]